MKLFFVTNRLGPVITTILVIICLGAIYFFVYLPRNEKNIQEQRFRALQNLDDNIQAKIENSAALLNNLLINYSKGDLSNREGINDYIQKYPTEKFTLTPIKRIVEKDSRDHDVGYIVKIEQGTKQIGLLCWKVTDSVVIADVKSNAPSKKTPSYYQIEMKFSFEQFFGSLLLLSGKIFDHFVIINNHKPIYENFPSGISKMQEDSLLGGRPGVQVAAVRNVTIGGRDYKIFSQPVSLGEQCVISGLLSSQRYQRERNELPAEIVLSLMTLVIAMILMFPWIKLFHMGSKDRLTVWDAIASFSVSMLLMSFLFLAFFKYNFRFRLDDQWHPKEFLAMKIETSFRNEIESIYGRLKTLDSIRLRGHLTDSNHSYIKIDKNTATYYSNYEKDTVNNVKVRNDSIAMTVRNAAIKYVYWLDDTGYEKTIWATDSIIAPHGNYKERNYFKNIWANKPYYLHDTSEYFLDQIISWITGSFRSVLSIGSVDTDGVKVAAVTFDMESLKEMVLPTGYLFAMINDSGKVLYHSQSFRNLNENLLNEFSETDKLKSSLLAHTASSFKTSYFSRNYQVYTRPLTGLPYFIVVMEDNGYEQTKNMEIYSFTFSMLLFFFLFLILQILIIFIVASRKSFFKRQLFNTSWIGPKFTNKTDYVTSSLFNISLAILLIAVSAFSFISFLVYFFILLFSVTASPVFLNHLYAKRYMHHTKSSEHLPFKIRVLKCLYTMIFLIDFIACFLLGWSVLFLIVYELLVFGIGFFFYKEIKYPGRESNDIINKTDENIQKLSKKINLLRRAQNIAPKKAKAPIAPYIYRVKLQASLVRLWKSTYTNSFPIMMLTRLIITSGIPIVFFYISSYNYEQNINTRNKQSFFLNAVADKEEKNPPADQTPEYTKGIYFDGMTIKDFPSLLLEKKPIKTLKGEEKRTVDLLKVFHLHLTDEAVSAENFNSAASDDQLLIYNDLFHDSTTVTYREHRKPGQYSGVESVNLNYQLPNPLVSDFCFNGILFWMLLMAALVIFYFILRTIIKRMFGLGVPDLTKTSEFDSIIFDDQDLNKFIFVIGSPGAGKTKLIKKKLRAKAIKSRDGQDIIFEESEFSDTVAFADMIHIPDSNNDQEDNEAWKRYSNSFFAEKNKLVVVNHFEYNIQDPVTNRIKLNFLEKLMVDDTRKVIILSTIHPVAFLDSAFIDVKRQATDSGKKNKKDDKADDPLKTLPEDLERWHVLLGHSLIVLMPLQENSAFKEKHITPQQRMIYGETNWGQLLNKMRSAMMEAVASNQATGAYAPTPDEWAFKLQVTSYYFYMYIWQSLTREEKFLLYDLAEDNLVNPFDDYNLSMLIGKGLIVRDNDTLKLFNRGFRNFILTAIGNSEAMKIKDQIKDNGNWGKLKTPLTIIIITILAFLLASQEEAYSRLMAYVTALVAGVPVILRLFSLFNKNQQQSS